jgi:hypothetical protein
MASLRRRDSAQAGVRAGGPARPCASWLLVVMLALCPPVAADDGAEGFDILGFRLGMTRDEAEAVFRRLNPDIELKVQNSYYSFSDGLNDHQTDEFLDRISGTIRHDRATKAILSVIVEFSPPPEGGTVVQIVRQDNNIANPVTLAEYRQALIGKYGPPATELYGLQWHFPEDRSLCSSNASGPGAHDLKTLVQGRDREQKLANPSLCASYLTFRMTGDPVGSVYARMVDVEQAIRAQLAANAWVAELQAEAVARRKAQGQGPEL